MTPKHWVLDNAYGSSSPSHGLFFVCRQRNVHLSHHVFGDGPCLRTIKLTEALDKPKASAVFLSRPSSPKYKYTATCVSASTEALRFVHCCSMCGRSSSHSFSKFSLHVLKFSLYSSATAIPFHILSHPLDVLP